MASSKPIQEQIYKSRLTITYRTTITGTPQEESLPFRLLVLGPFAGRRVRDSELLAPLADRQVRTIKRGRSVNDHLGEVLPIWRFPKDEERPSQELKDLRSHIPGSVTIASITVSVPAGLKDGDARTLSVQGTAVFSSTQEANGFCEIEAQELKIRGTFKVTKAKDQGVADPKSWSEPKLTLHGLALADRLDPATHTPSGKIVAVADNAKIQGLESVAWKIDVVEDDLDDGSGKPKPTQYTITAAPDDAGKAKELSTKLERAVPFTSLDAWTPDKLVESIPEIERVRVLKRLVGRVHSELRNRPELRAKFKGLLPLPDDKPKAKAEKIAAFAPLQTWIDTNLPALKVGSVISKLEAANKKKDDAAARAAAAKKLADDTKTAAADAKTKADDAKTKATAAKAASDADTANADLKKASDEAEAASKTAEAAATAAEKRADDAAKAVTAADAEKTAADAAAAAVGKAVTEAETPAKEIQDKLLAPIDATSNDLYFDGPAGARTAWAVVRHDPKEDVLVFDDRNTDITDAAWLMNGLAVLLANAELAATEIRRVAGEKPKPEAALDDCLGSYPQFLQATSTLARLLDEKTQSYLDAVYHEPSFQRLEAIWRGLADLAGSVESDDVFIDFLDAGREELISDLVDHDLDMFSGALFNKVYIGEYDRYGGKPFAAMIGLYDIGSSKEHIDFLRAMGRVANASHCPFIAAAAPDFFAPYKSIEDVAEISDLDAVLADPHFGRWQELRDTEYAAYLGLTLPRYLVREPWKPETLGNEIGYREEVPYARAAGEGEARAGRHDDAALKENLLWGYASVLFAKNMVASYQGSGWAQYLRGPRGGGLCQGLVSYKYTKNGYEEIQPPVEISIPDYRELQFANNGFIPLVHKKGEAVATFFSAQSLKKSKRFVEDLSTKNAALVTNLAYTFSITRIAHYVKRMMREYIGASADGPYIQKVLAAWLGQYVTIVANPDDLTLRYYPFKAATVDVQPKPGPLGWYKAVIKILPHIQFEGMDVELQLEAALGGP